MNRIPPCLPFRHQPMAQVFNARPITVSGQDTVLFGAKPRQRIQLVHKVATAIAEQKPGYLVGNFLPSVTDFARDPDNDVIPRTATLVYSDLAKVGLIQKVGHKWQIIAQQPTGDLPQPPPTESEKVAALIRAGIENGFFPVGHMLPPMDQFFETVKNKPFARTHLTQLKKFTRGVVKGGYQLLAQEGLLQKTQGKGQPYAVIRKTPESEPIKIHPKAASQFMQIALALENRIRGHEFPADEAFPNATKMAEEYDTSLETMARAYRVLVKKKYLRPKGHGESREWQLKPEDQWQHIQPS